LVLSVYNATEMYGMWSVMSGAEKVMIRETKVYGPRNPQHFWLLASSFRAPSKSIGFPSYKEMEDALGHQRQNSKKL